MNSVLAPPPIDARAPHWGALALFALVASCGMGTDPSDRDTGAPDHGTVGATDGGARDSSATDSGASDSGVMDSGATDSGARDAGDTSDAAIDGGSDAQTPTGDAGGVPNPLRILPLGDSLTQGGVNGDLPGELDPSTINGYRLELWNLLTAAGYHLDYVGSEQIGNASLPDRDEQGTSGACIMVSPCGGGTMYPQTAGWLDAYDPDLVIMQGGENDFSNGTLTEEQDAANMERWIQLVWETKPNAKIIVTGAPWHDTYDGLVHSYVDGLQADGRPIRWVPYGADIGRIDGTHPNAAGYVTWAHELAPMVQQLFPR